MGFGNWHQVLTLARQVTKKPLWMELFLPGHHSIIDSKEHADLRIRWPESQFCFFKGLVYWLNFICLGHLFICKIKIGDQVIWKVSSNSTIYNDPLSENLSICDDLVASGDVFVEDFQPRERFGIWPSMVTSSLLLLILSPFPSVHTTWPPFLLDAVHPPAREQVQKTSVFLELSCFCVLPAEIPSGASVPGQLLLWEPSFPFVLSALSLRGGLDRIVPWGQTWYIFSSKADLFWNLNALDTCLQAQDPELSIGCLPGGPSLPSRLLHLSEGIATRQSENASFNCDLS